MQTATAANMLPHHHKAAIWALVGTCVIFLFTTLSLGMDNAKLHSTVHVLKSQLVGEIVSGASATCQARFERREITAKERSSCVLDAAAHARKLVERIVAEQ